MKKKTAIALARSEFSEVHQITPGTRGWGYRSLDEKAKAWRNSPTYLYNAAREVRAEMIATRAYILMGGDFFDAWNCFQGGSISDRLNGMLHKYPLKEYLEAG